ncbi:MAG TPA: Crp/Fnr family transcriptional regulator [Caldimonas sp.]|jgi:CRP-like cAMP-binding protein|nr:Crp/Fnr family transcriptional regulator [Caldimonas sp.]HEX2539908.1 Crp/Fnr family transcriptional regulator [Caldimonas sp.]
MKNGTKPLGEVLEEAPWMRFLPAAARERVKADAYASLHGVKDLVARKGEPVHAWIGVAEGLLKATDIVGSGKGVMFNGIPAGAWVGEGSVIKRELRRYDLVAIRPSRIVHVPRATFRWLLETSFEFNRFVIEHLNERLSQFIAMVETERLSDPCARVARAVSGLYNPVLYPGLGPFLQVSQEELGDVAGLSRQRTNAAIKRLAVAGLVRPAYGGLFIVDLPGLRAYRSD